MEYNHLLVTQLESQRAYFEGLLVRQRAEADSEVEAAGAAAGAARTGADAARAAAAESERRRRQAESKLVGGWRVLAGGEGRELGSATLVYLGSATLDARSRSKRRRRGSSAHVSRV